MSLAYEKRKIQYVPCCIETNCIIPSSWMGFPGLKLLHSRAILVKPVHTPSVFHSIHHPTSKPSLFKLQGPPPNQHDFAGIGLGLEQFIQFPDPNGGALHLIQGHHDDALISQREQDTNTTRISLSQETRINGQSDGQPQHQLGTATRERRHVIANYMAQIVQLTGSASPTEIAETGNHLINTGRLLQEWANQPARGQQSQAPVEEQTPSVVTNEAVTALYTCWICQATFTHLPSFSRHIESLHIPRRMFYCDILGCLYQDARRDKMRDHYLQAHTIRATRGQLDEMKTDFPCPGMCPICTQLVRSWSEFYRCWIGHCTFPPGRNGPPGNDGGEDPDNGGAGPSPGDGSRPVGRASGGTGMGLPYSTPRAQRRGSTTRRRGQNQRSVDAQSPIVARTNRRPASTRGNTQPSTPSTQDGRRQSVHEIIPPRLAQHNDTMRTHQPADQAQSLPRESLHCQQCNHIFVACSECCFLGASTFGCHICSQALRNISLTARMELAMRGDSHQIAFLSAHDPQIRGNIGGSVQATGFTQYGGPFANQNHLDYHPQGRGGGATAAPFGSSNSNFDVGAFMVTVPEHHLDENEISLCNSKNSASQLLATSRSLPIRFLLHKGMSKLPQTESLIADCKDYSPRAVSPFPAHEKIVLPSPVCSPYPPIQTVSHKGKTCIELASGKVLCVDMQVLPDEQERGAHPLRTRVRVLVKLLKLRSSVARAGNKQKAKEYAETVEQALCTSFNALNLGSKSVKIVDEKDDRSSDVDSEADEVFSDTKFEALSASETSISDQALFLNEKSDLLDDFETEFQFRVDIEVDRLSTWTDAFADLEANIEDTKINDNARVFAILFRYILYLIFGSRRFLKHGSYPKLLE
ncbi:hypothetical protein N7488_005323 [Penicillium malachiteum]|nr:hypothetical protein N7488_005323 [Penicillium malachiteum]